MDNSSIRYKNNTPSTFSYLKRLTLTLAFLASVTFNFYTYFLICKADNLIYHQIIMIYCFYILNIIPLFTF